MEQPLTQRLNGGAHPRVGGGKKAEHGHLQHGRIQTVVVVGLSEGADLWIPGASLDLAAQARRRLLPLSDVPCVAGAARDRDRTVESDPAPKLAVRVMLTLALELPD